jgi:hypothetical protein
MFPAFCEGLALCVELCVACVTGAHGAGTGAGFLGALGGNGAVV